MAQLDSDAIKSNFSKKTNHYWGVQGLIGLGLPDQNLLLKDIKIQIIYPQKQFRKFFLPAFTPASCHHN